MTTRKNYRYTEADFEALTQRAIKRAGGRAGEARSTIEVVPGKPYSFTVLGIAQPGGSKQAFVPVDKKKICECGPIPGKLPFRREGGSIIVSVVDANPNAKKWKEHAARIAAEEYQGPMFDGPIAATFTFYRPRPDSHYGAKGLNKQGRDNPFPATKPDVLKLARALEDALTGICYVDDALIVRETLRKEYGEPARVEITLEALAVETGQTSLLEMVEPPPPWQEPPPPPAPPPSAGTAATPQRPDDTRAPASAAPTGHGTSAGHSGHSARIRRTANVARQASKEPNQGEVNRA